MPIRRTYSTVEICELFGISKSTLFRWERESWLPPVPRDANGQRQYTNVHLKAIAKRLRKRYSGQYEQASKSEDVERMATIQQTLSYIKFLEGDPTGLQELKAHPSLPGHIIRHLTRILADYYTPDDPEYCDLVHVLYKHCRKREAS